VSAPHLDTTALAEALGNLAAWQEATSLRGAASPGEAAKAMEATQALRVQVPLLVSDVLSLQEQLRQYAGRLLMTPERVVVELERAKLMDRALDEAARQVAELVLAGTQALMVGEAHGSDAGLKLLAEYLTGRRRVQNSAVVNEEA
jgi:hypothetical protein